MTFNIFNQLTPKPPFDPAKKNKAVVVPKPMTVTKTNKATTVFTKGINRTKS